MHERNRKVAQELAAAGITGEIVLLDETAHTAELAAKFLGVDVGAIANSLIFSADGAPVLIMTSGAHRVDTAHTAAVIGAESLDRAPKEMVKLATGQVIGGVAPCGHPAPVRTYIDVALREYPELWAAAGTANSVFPLSYDQLVALTGGEEITVEP